MDLSPSARIISASRRTDIPAWYGDWFMRRVEAGFAGWENPYGRRRHLVSLRREDVVAFAFWSKNFRPFLEPLRRLQSAGYPCWFNYTITGLPRSFEPGGVAAEDAIDSLRELAARFTPEAVSWRYDPIILSDRTPRAWHTERFAALAAALEGHTRRCVVSYVMLYGKVVRSLARFERAEATAIRDPPPDERRLIGEELAAIAQRHGMRLESCCGDYLVGGPVAKAHCIDGAAISRLYHGGTWRPQARGTRPECGCAASVDIGHYDSCANGCVYCYANADAARAARCRHLHDPASPFLGVPAPQGEAWVEEARGSGK